MPGPHDQHEFRVVVHGIHHAVCASTGRPVSGELPAQGFADPPRLLDKGAGDELNYRRRDRAGNTFEGPGGTGRDPEFERAQRAKKRARSSADVR